MSRISILNYHDALPEGASFEDVPVVLRPYVLSSEAFERQLRLIRDNGYSVLSLRELVEGKNLSFDRSCAITFDDGWRNNYFVVYPLLKKYGYTATFFIVAGEVGEQDMMSWEQLKELASNGMTIGSHTLTHRYPSELSSNEIEYELRESKRLLEERLGGRVDFLSIPTGFHNKKMLEFAKHIGYKAVCSGIEGFADRKTNSFALKTICIRRATEEDEFVKILQCDPSTIVKRRLRQLAFKGAKKVLGVNGYNTIRSSILSKVR